MRIRRLVVVPLIVFFSILLLHSAYSGVCPTCGGSGDCPQCGGRRYIPAHPIHGQPAAYGCEACGGVRGDPRYGGGRPGTGKCSTCGGTGQVEDTTEEKANKLNEKGNEAFNQKDYQTAIFYYGQAYAQDPWIGYKKNWAAAYNNLGNVLFNQRRYAEARAAYQQAINIFPDEPNAKNNLKNLEETIANEADKRERDRKVEEARKLNQKGNEALARRNYESAIGYYKQAHELDPWEGYKKNEALARERLRKSKEFTKIKEAYELNEKGNEAYNLKNYRAAIDYYRRAYDLNPKDIYLNNEALASNVLGNMLVSAKRYKEAEQVRQQYLRHAPIDIHSYICLVYALRKQGRYDEAKATAREAQNLDPENQVLREALEQASSSWFDPLKKLWDKTKQALTPKTQQSASKEQQAKLKPEFERRLDSANERSQPIDAPIKNDKSNRSAGKYHEVIEQFQLKKEPGRYKRDKYTYCNIFVWDVTRAMVGPEEEIPHLVNGKEMQVNQLVDWLHKEGKKKGWHRVDVRVGYQMATEGHPTVAIWKNPKKRKNPETGKMEEESGHTSMVRPGNPDDRGPAIAQAGSAVLDARHLKEGFNDKHFKRKIEFWYHE